MDCFASLAMTASLRFGCLKIESVSTRLARPGCRAMRLLDGAMPRPPCRSMDRFCRLAFKALLQRIHQVDHVAGFFRAVIDPDRLAGGLASHQCFQGVLVFVLEFRRIEM